MQATCPARGEGAALGDGPKGLGLRNEACHAAEQLLGVAARLARHNQGAGRSPHRHPSWMRADMMQGRGRLSGLDRCCKVLCAGRSTHWDLRAACTAARQPGPIRAGAWQR